MLTFVVLILASAAAYVIGALAKLRGGSPWFWGSSFALLTVFGVSVFLEMWTTGFRYAPSVAPLIVQLILGAFCAYVCGAWAKKQGQSAWFWGNVGAIFTVFGLVALAIFWGVRQFSPKIGQSAGSLDGSKFFVAFIAAGVLAGFVLGVFNRPSLAGMGQPPIDVAFSVFGAMGGTATQTGDFLTNQMVRMNTSLSRDYAGQFAQTLATYSFLGGAVGAVSAFFYGKRYSLKTPPSPPSR